EGASSAAYPGLNGRQHDNTLPPPRQKARCSCVRAKIAEYYTARIPPAGLARAEWWPSPFFIGIVGKSDCAASGRTGPVPRNRFFRNFLLRGYFSTICLTRAQVSSKVFCHWALMAGSAAAGKLPGISSVETVILVPAPAGSNAYMVSMGLGTPVVLVAHF